MDAVEELLLQREINTGREEINTSIEDVSTGSTKVDSGTASERGLKGRKRLQWLKRISKLLTKQKNKWRQEQAGLEEAIKKAQVQFEAQFYTEEDWDTIRAKLEANAELSKDRQRLSKRNSYDSVKVKESICTNISLKNYTGNLGASPLNKLKFEEIKEEFDKLVQQIDTFVPINLKATKTKLKRYGEELQTKTSKKQMFDDKDVPAIGDKVAEVKEEEPVKKTGKRKKQKARKGINVDKSAQEDSETDK
ncbi:hypothetical protein Tco_0718625, partial [Tanacetum coccineum]